MVVWMHLKCGYFIFSEYGVKF